MTNGKKIWTMMKLNNQYHSMPKTIFQIKYLEEYTFAIEAMYQSRMESRAKCNTPLLTIINARMKATTNANVLQ